MSQKVTLKTIAKVNNTSISTVCNALHGGASVNLDLKKRILKTAYDLNYNFTQKDKEVEQCSIAVLMPSTPMYFWSEAKQGIQEAAKEKKIQLSMFIYSNIKDDDDFIYCLKRAENIIPDVYIIVPPCSENARKEISKLNKPIIFLNEYINIDVLQNVGFVGSDTYSDGKRFAETCKVFLSDNPRVLIIDVENDNYMIQRRKQGFCDYLPSNAVVVGEIRQSSSPTMAAKMAQIITKKYMIEEYILKFDCIFAATGLIPQVCLALKKLDIIVPCIGCEKPNIAPKYIPKDVVYGQLVQPIRMQGAESIKYAVRLYKHIDTMNKSITLPSDIYINGKRLVVNENKI